MIMRLKQNPNALTIVRMHQRLKRLPTVNTLVVLLTSVSLLLAACSNFNLSANVPVSDPMPPAPVNATSVYNGCAKPSSAAPAHAYYVDPVRGSMTNDGSQSHPWSTLEAVAKGGKLTSIVKPGDAVYLRDGNHGNVIFKNVVNTDFITIAADQGQTPVLKQLYVLGVGKWNFQGLTVEGAKDPNVADLVDIVNSSDVIFNQGTVRAQADTSAWTKQDWRDKAPLGLIAGNDSCLAVTNSNVANIRRGIAVQSDRVLVAGNTIERSSGDGIDYDPGVGIQISDNVIRNSVDACEPPPGVKPSTVCTHQDGIQGQFIYNDPSRLGQDVVIARNQIFAVTRSDLKFLATALQGITSFDGNWKNVTIINNIALINAYHAITVGGADGGLVANNTVFNTDPTRNAWIAVGSTHQGYVSRNVTVRNNIANQIQVKADANLNVVVDHNLATTDPGSVVRSFDVVNSIFDVHLKAGSPAIAAGTSSLAPVTDLEGVTRADPFDLGAYVYR